MKNAVVVKNLTKSFADFSLDGIDLEIPEGSVFGLVGENGAGKSTLINSILGISNASYDELRYFGKDFGSNQKAIKEQLAVIFDQCHYDPECTPKIIGSIMKHSYQSWDSQKFSTLLERFELPTKKKLKNFSRGMKMKLEFAMALSHDTKLLILDEATSGLDPVFRDDILEILRIYSEDENHTVLMSSHITSDLDKIADYVAFIHKGKLLFVKSYDAIREDYGIITCGKEAFESLNKADIVAYRTNEFSVKVLIQNKQTLAPKRRDLTLENATLEDILLFTLKGESVLC